MSTRSSAAAAASSSSSTRKRRSTSASPAESPAKRRSTRGAGGASAAATVADPPALVPVAPPATGDWFNAMRCHREAGEFIDITLLVGGRKIPAHKIALVCHSPYLHGLLTSGLAESKQGGDTLKIGDDTTDGRAVEAIVDCFYSGMLSLSRSTVSSVIRTANLLGVGAVEKAACDFFVESIEPSTACEALAFAAAHSECGEHARGLRKRCVEYAVEHFAECGGEQSFLELPCEAVAEVIGSDDLPVEEAAVVTAVRAWFDHDASGRPELLKALLPLVRWPLLPVEMQLSLSQEPLLKHVMRLDDEALSLGIQLVTECIAEFAASDAAAACPRLKRRKGTAPPVLPLAFTVLSQEHYETSEDGALLTSTGNPHYRPALCREMVMSSGQSCAEVTVVRNFGYMMIGVGRPTLDPSAAYAHSTADFWGVYSTMNGMLFHNGDGQDWQGQQRYGTGDVLRLLLDSDAGTLTIKKNGTLLGVAVTSGLTGDLCWVVSMYVDEDDEDDEDEEEAAVRIKALDPAEF
eukprot:COSAG06_NODE_5488_length_3446_cov_112.319390_1_plen_521_part_00